MPKKKSNKQTKIDSSKALKAGKCARSFLQPDKNVFTWAIRSDKIDWSHPYFGFHEEVLNTFCQIIKPKLDSFSSMSWYEVDKKKSCHPMDVIKVEKELKNRLVELHGESAPETLYQINLDGTHRIWGYKDNSIFYLLFNDPEHKGYRVSKKHT